jgi:two-component system cell cycle sensor histidine kinase/response regulator CckA
MDDVVRQVVELQRAALGRKNIRVNFNAPGDLPMVDGDPKLLAQVFQSIVVNAEQSISATRDHGAVDVSCALLNGHVRVTILDDGPGIAPENLGKIFDPFFTTKRPGGGTGLGLTICMAVIKDHGGKIEVESSPHGGAAFHVFLPVASGMPAAAAQAAPATVAASNSGGLHGQTVLIVDDEDSILEIVQEGLSARGVKVHTAATPEAAMAHLANTSFDIVVCDFNLPGLSGEQLFESLRAQLGSSLPRFVFMTGELVDGAVSARLREKGASVLQKPFHVSALAALCAAARQPEPSTAN